MSWPQRQAGPGWTRQDPAGRSGAEQSRAEQSREAGQAGKPAGGFCPTQLPLEKCEAGSSGSEWAENTVHPRDLVRSEEG